MITTSEVAVSLTIDSQVHLAEILKELEPFGTTEVDENQVIISVVEMKSARPPISLKIVWIHHPVSPCVWYPTGQPAQYFPC